MSRGSVQATDEYQPLVPKANDTENEFQAQKPAKGTASSIMTIFSVWYNCTTTNFDIIANLLIRNTMMGSGLLTLPWGFSEAGLLGGIVVILIVGVVAWYTCWLVLKYGEQYGEFMEMTRHHFGKESSPLPSLSLPIHPFPLHLLRLSFALGWRVPCVGS